MKGNYGEIISLRHSFDFWRKLCVILLRLRSKPLSQNHSRIFQRFVCQKDNSGHISLANHKKITVCTLSSFSNDLHLTEKRF